MDTNLSIFRKGLILVGIPLLAQAVFLGVLLVVRGEQEDAQFSAMHAKEVIAQTEATYRVLVEAQTHMRGYVLTNKDVFIHDFEKKRLEVPRAYAALKRLVDDNPPQLEKVKRMEDLAGDFIGWMNENIQFNKQGKRAEVEERISALAGRSHMEALRGATDDFLEKEIRLDALRVRNLERTSALGFYVLLGGVGLAVLSSGVLLVVFSRGIARRLAVLAENTRLLGEGKELAPRLGGRDELSLLDHVFHDMADALRHKDEENEMFVYSVSHDLRSPLVNLQGFSQELALILNDIHKLLKQPEVPGSVQERGRKLLERNAAEAIHYIQTAVTRLAAIIEALLQLSRAGRVEYRWQNVDIQSTVQRIVQSLNDSLSRRGAMVSVGALPPAWGDPTSLDHIFANLLANAVNYLDPSRPGQIEVGCETASEAAPGMQVYYVKDNGLGIPEPLQAKVFVAFQRLHPDAAPGEGIGLALVKRAVERHGGKIWLESKPGEGTVFHVALSPPLPASAAAAKAVSAPALLKDTPEAVS